MHYSNVPGERIAYTYKTVAYTHTARLAVPRCHAAINIHNKAEQNKFILRGALAKCASGCWTARLDSAFAEITVKPVSHFKCSHLTAFIFVCVLCTSTSIFVPLRSALIAAPRCRGPARASGAAGVSARAKWAAAARHHTRCRAINCPIPYLDLRQRHSGRKVRSPRKSKPARHGSA